MQFYWASVLCKLSINTLILKLKKIFNILSHTHTTLGTIQVFDHKLHWRTFTQGVNSSIYMLRKVNVRGINYPYRRLPGSKKFLIYTVLVNVNLRTNYYLHIYTTILPLSNFANHLFECSKNYSWDYKVTALKLHLSQLKCHFVVIRLNLGGSFLSRSHHAKSSRWSRCGVLECSGRPAVSEISMPYYAKLKRPSKIVLGFSWAVYGLCDRVTLSFRAKDGKHTLRIELAFSVVFENCCREDLRCFRIRVLLLHRGSHSSHFIHNSCSLGKVMVFWYLWLKYNRSSL